jgi:hypothetical protein
MIPIPIESVLERLDNEAFKKQLEMFGELSQLSREDEKQKREEEDKYANIEECSCYGLGQIFEKYTEGCIQLTRAALIEMMPLPGDTSELVVFDFNTEFWDTLHDEAVRREVLILKAERLSRGTNLNADSIRDSIDLCHIIDESTGLCTPENIVVLSVVGCHEVSTGTTYYIDTSMHFATVNLMNNHEISRYDWVYTWVR